MRRPSAWIRSIALFAATFVAVALYPSASHGADLNDIYWIPDRNLLGSGAFVDAVVIAAPDIFYGGSFQVRNTDFRDCVHWDGAKWESLGGTVGTRQMGMVHVIARSGNDLYVGGMFDQLATIIPAGNIGKWDGANWDAMNLGTDRAVRAITIAPNGDVYAGGEFTSAGGVPNTRGIARWDGSQWHSVGGSVNNHVNAILIDGDNIYVGGRFSQAGGKDIAFLARFDGTEWSAVGSGVDNFVNTFSKRGNRLIVGGGFRMAGEWDARGIATWNGTRWKPLGDGISGPGLALVRAIAYDEDYIYAGGYFQQAGGQPANYIARWDGEEWTAMGSGLSNTVKHLLMDGDELIVTGEFTGPMGAGLKRSNFIARWVQPYVVFREFLGAETETEDGFGLTWKVRLNGKVDGFNVYRKAADESTPTLVGNMLAAGARSFVDTGYDGGKTYTYTLAAVKRSGAEILAEEDVMFESPAASVSYPFGLSQNYPNPFNPRTTIEFTLPEESHVELVVFDVRGNQVKRLLDEVRPSGINMTDWNGTNEAGAGVPTGIYFYRMTWGSTVETRKMILMK
ncbi:MAG: T9SS type A sorting domain-containing protein [bacterium]|nr:T9SS type A sorting domain-containing protein [bacterium]